MLIDYDRTPIVLAANYVTKFIHLLALSLNLHVIFPPRTNPRIGNCKSEDQTIVTANITTTAATSTLALSTLPLSLQPCQCTEHSDSV